MKKTTRTVEASAPESYQAFFDAQNIEPDEIVIFGEKNAPRKYSAAAEKTETRLLNKVLAAIKLTFLYLPGVALIHFTLLGWALAFMYEDISTELVTSTLGFFAAGTFMVMFGIGRLLDLKYLRVVAAVFLISVVAAVSFWLVAGFYKVDYFGVFLLVSCLFTAVVGYLVKMDTDGIKQI